MLLSFGDIFVSSAFRCWIQKCNSWFFFPFWLACSFCIESVYNKAKLFPCSSCDFPITFCSLAAVGIFKTSTWFKIQAIAEIFKVFAFCLFKAKCFDFRTFIHQLSSLLFVDFKLLFDIFVLCFQLRYRMDIIIVTFEYEFLRLGCYHIYLCKDTILTFSHMDARLTSLIVISCVSFYN